MQFRFSALESIPDGLDPETSKADSARVGAQRFLAFVRRCSKGRSGGGGGKLGRKIASRFDRAARDCLRAGRCTALGNIIPIALSTTSGSSAQVRIAPEPSSRGPFRRSDYDHSLSRALVDSLVGIDSGRVRYASDLLVAAIRRHTLVMRYASSRRGARSRAVLESHELDSDRIIAQLAETQLRADDLRRMRESLSTADVR